MSGRPVPDSGGGQTQIGRAGIEFPNISMPGMCGIAPSTGINRSRKHSSILKAGCAIGGFLEVVLGGYRDCQKAAVACFETVIDRVTSHRQSYLTLLFPDFAVMLKFGGNHEPGLDTPEFDEKILLIPAYKNHSGILLFFWHLVEDD